ncbi:MAG TPA: ATP-binding protein [Tepidisphaeraceae bacterium]|nr:ATP-binding protein [Tepidisphaeraceae bacterium]
MNSIDRVDAALVEELLYGSEGVDLDFKRDQYLFDGASDLDKSELLKDILAFANAFRRNDAFILIGAEEVACGRPKIIGVTNHLKDADLQQFVNTKTNRNITFSYHAVDVEGKQVGIIRIQDQQRPVVLKKGFCFDAANNRHVLTADTVYLRVGSSTKVASPEDIIRMGSHVAHHPIYDVDLQFANFRDKTPTGTMHDSTHNMVLCNDKIPNYTTQNYSTSPYSIQIPRLSMDRNNPRFWRQAYNYLRHWGSLVEVGFCVHNRGNTTIDDVTVEMAFTESDGLLLVSRAKMPQKPEPRLDYLNVRMPELDFNGGYIHVEKRGDRTVVTLSFGKLQAGEQKFLPEALYLGAPRTGHLIVEALVRADEFPSPLRRRLELRTNGGVHTIAWSALKKLIEEHFFSRDESDDAD